VSLSKPYAAVNEEWIVAFAWLFCDALRSGITKLVIIANNEIGEGVLGI
jgi:glutamate racemase